MAVRNKRVYLAKIEDRPELAILLRNGKQGRSMSQGDDIDVVPAESDQKRKLGWIGTLVRNLRLRMHVIIEPLEDLARLILNITELGIPQSMVALESDAFWNLG